MQKCNYCNQEYNNRKKMINFDNKLFCKKTCLQKYCLEQIENNLDFNSNFNSNLDKKYVEKLVNLNNGKYISRIKININTKSMINNFLWKYKGNKDKKCLTCGRNILQSYLKRNVLYLPEKTTYCSMSCALKNEETQNKIKNTKKERYGNENYNNMLKNKQTKKERYGNENYNNMIKNKQTLKEKYNVTSSFQLEHVEEKRKQSCVLKYGVERPFQNKEIQNKINKNVREKHLIEYKEKYKNILNNLENNINSYVKKGRINGTKICEDFNLHYKELYIINKYFNIFSNYEIYFEQGNSKMEKEIAEYIKSIYDGKIIENDRKILNGKELDIYIPDKNFAIEYDGLLYHSYGKTFPNNVEILDKNYHLNKTIQCEEKNIHLFHIFENEWLDEIKKDIWKSKIAIKLYSKKLNKLNARNGYIKPIDTFETKIFLDQNHLQGYVQSKIKLGFFIKNELLGVITFGKSRFKKDEYELIRFATRKYTIIRGLFSKFIKYFKKNYNISNLISYGNRRWTYKNNVYDSLMELESISNPNYFYFKNGDLYSRIKFQKHKLKNILENFNEDKTELENVLDNNYRIIYDCGNYKYKL